MPRNIFASLVHSLYPKDNNRNLISASFHMITITLICMSLVDLNWFTLSGGVCVPYLTLGKFFWFGYTVKQANSPEYECVNTSIVNMMRITILLCFMAIIFSMAGFFLEITAPKSMVYKMIRRYAVAGMCTVLWILVIIIVSYYVVLLLEDSLGRVYPNVESSVSYGYGFYFLSAAGAVSLIGVVYTLIVMHNTSGYLREDDRCLIDGFDDGMDIFNSPAPPPPYNIPPPPYTP